MNVLFFFYFTLFDNSDLIPITSSPWEFKVLSALHVYRHIKNFLIKTYRLTVAGDNSGVGVFLVTSAKRKIFALLKY